MDVSVSILNKVVDGLSGDVSLIVAAVLDLVVGDVVDKFKV